MFFCCISIAVTCIKRKYIHCFVYLIECKHISSPVIYMFLIVWEGSAICLLLRTSRNQDNESGITDLRKWNISAQEINGRQRCLSSGVCRWDRNLATLKEGIFAVTLLSLFVMQIKISRNVVLCLFGKLWNFSNMFFSFFLLNFLYKKKQTRRHNKIIIINYL